MRMHFGLAALALMLTSSASAVEPTSDHFRLSYAIHIDGPGLTQVWVPLAHDTAFQQVQMEASTYLSKHDGANANKFGFVEVYAPADVVVNYDVKREEQTAVKDITKDVQQWLRPDKLVPLNDDVRSLAHEVTKQIPAGASNTEKARAIYDYIVSSMKYDKSGEGWGRGDFQYACKALKGNCTDFHSLFIGLCRACDVPARFTMGLSIPEGKDGKVEGYHCWAEFFDPKVGWVPVDASVATQTQQREFYFGKLDSHRVAFTLGRDLKLEPSQSGDLLNYMIFAYAERDGKIVPAKTAISFER